MARSFAIALVTAMVFCTVLLLICPVAWGPYSATHGPVTALRAMRSVATLMFSMLLAATALSSNASVPALRHISFRSDSILLPRGGQAGTAASLLRC